MVDAPRPSVLLSMERRHLPRLFDDAARARLRQVAKVDLADEAIVADFQAPGVAERLKDTEILLTGWGSQPVDEAVLAHAPNLEAIVHSAGSVKAIVTDACWQRGLAVSNAVAANAVPVAEYTVAMIVLANKHVLPIRDAYRTQNAKQDWAITYPTIGNYGQVIGIVGASHVGREVLRLLASYDFELLLSDPTLTAAEAERLGAELVDLDELVTRSDVVSIHAPDLPATYHLFDQRRLARLKDQATLINTARGRLIDTAALTEEAATGRLDVILDVTDPEPLPPDSKLFQLPNVFLTPHLAGSTGVEVRRMGELAVAEIERYARGEPFAHPVDGSRIGQLA
ncbi:hydroxyacid dehydrogenase [Tenggerimyces flavus]|uniref:Hydroxyacid dehydrogenase n=1 Tax=Tenggerimyces flavus TaxID=1708749 RepID=A0ABV7Y6K5_9ACTN|nr:hydroxyacid dehydrogenase [Tenggerimyces flavus]MBM7785343.1 phosphoglycerate dehydrogenase-like enzyme [Tenggerimyces flavus]